MTIYLRQSTASQEVPLGYFVDSTDGNTEETALTIANTDIKIWKTGATTLANKNSGGATHISNGIYYAVLDATDTDTIGSLVIFVHVSGALTTRLECMVLDEVMYDWWTGTGTPTTGGAITVTSGRVNADVTHIATAAVSTSTAQLGVNVVNAGGTAWGSGAITAGSIAADAITAAKVAADVSTEIRSLASGTSDSGTTTTMVDAARTEADTDYWVGNLIVFTSGNIAGQSRYITGFNAATDTITFAPATTQAVSTQTYEIWPVGDFLRPTTSGRTLDVSAGGEAGIDWANVGSPTTTNNLSGTTIATTQKVDVETIKTNAVVNGGTVTFPTNATLASTTNITAGTVTTATNVTTVNGLAANVITAASMAADASAEIADAVWDEAASGHTTSGTYGQALNIVRANTAQAGAATTITLDASASAVDDFYNNTIIFITGGTGVGQSRIISDYVGATKVASVSAWATNPSSDSVFVILPFGAIPGASAPTAAEVADAVWDEDATGHQTQGTFGQVLGDSGADSDSIWALANTNLDATISSRLASASYTAPLDAAGTRTAVGLASANLDTQLDALPTAVENADALLGRNVSGGSSSGRLVKQALHVLRNKTDIAGGTLTVYDTDDSTTSFTAAVTTTAGDPITTIDPA